MSATRVLTTDAQTVILDSELMELVVLHARLLLTTVLTVTTKTLVLNVNKATLLTTELVHFVVVC